MIYGLPGVGKTWLAAEGPNCLVIDQERGTKTLLHKPEKYESVRIIEPTAFKDVDSIMWAIRNEKLDVDTLVLDTITDFQSAHLGEILDAAHAKDQNRSEYLAEQQHYRLSTEMMRRHILALRELPVHFIITAHAVETKDEVLGRPFIRPAMTPKLASTIIGMMDLVAYMEVDSKGVRKLTCQPTSHITAKNRVGLPATIENPTFKGILGALQG